MNGIPSASPSSPAGGVPGVNAHAIPDHLVHLPGGDWRLWRTVGVRGAGFAAETVLRLADRESADAADACTDVQTFRDTFESRRHARDDAVREVAATALFQEALIWQNRRAFHTCVEPLLSGGHHGGSSTRRHQRMVANYLQRYCAKNDTIGFFGPVGWGRIDEQAPALTAAPGGTLLARRDVYFEPWAIDALADLLAKDEALQPWVTPRRLAFARLDGMNVRLPGVGFLKLSAGQAAVFEACDGAKTAREVAGELVRTNPGRFPSVADVYRFLAILRKLELISCEFSVPFDAHPERWLRRSLEQIGEVDLRQRALDTLSEFEAARCRVSQAAGDPERLDRALADMERVFTRITGEAATRHAGLTYAGRTLVYEDCRRDVSVTLGSDLLESLGPPLSLLLTSARWFTFELARGYRRLFREVYEGVVRETGSPIVEAVHLLPKLYPLIFGHENDVAASVESSFRDKWSDVLSLPAGETRVDYSAASLRARVIEAFEVPRPGWRGAFYHSPDVMIAASSVEAVQQGQYQLVLGELHLSANSLGALVFVEQHPSPEQLLLAIEHDMAQTGIVLVPPRDWLGGPKRTWRLLTSRRDFQLEVGSGVSPAPRSRTLQLSMLVARATGDSLEVHTRDGRLRFDLIDVLADTLVMASFSRFRMLGGSGHLPRVSIDRLVVCRETWRLAADSMEFARHKLEADRFLAARRWAAANGLPRWVFVKVPAEVKPFFVDFESPIYVDILAKAARRAIETGMTDSEFVVSEMLPTPDQLWLQNAQGERYTSELRIVAVDPAA
jgi:hypothetical protein